MPLFPQLVSPRWGFIHFLRLYPGLHPDCVGAGPGLSHPASLRRTPARRVGMEKFRVVFYRLVEAERRGSGPAVLGCRTLPR